MLSTVPHDACLYIPLKFGGRQVASKIRRIAELTRTFDCVLWPEAVGVVDFIGHCSIPAATTEDVNVMSLTVDSNLVSFAASNGTIEFQVDCVCWQCSLSA
jgi:hypothetical protein